MNRVDTQTAQSGLARNDLTPRCVLRNATGANPELLEEMTREFVAAYRNINQCVRELRSAQTASEFSRGRVHTAQQGVERAILARDALEDRYARKGMIATPIVRDGFIREVELSVPQASAGEPEVLTLCFPVRRPSKHGGKRRRLSQPSP